MGTMLPEPGEKDSKISRVQPEPLVKFTFEQVKLTFGKGDGDLGIELGQFDAAQITDPQDTGFNPGFDAFDLRGDGAEMPLVEGHSFLLFGNLDPQIEDICRDAINLKQQGKPVARLLAEGGFLRRLDAAPVIQQLIKADHRIDILIIKATAARRILLEPAFQGGPAAQGKIHLGALSGKSEIITAMGPADICPGQCHIGVVDDRLNGRTIITA